MTKKERAFRAVTALKEEYPLGLCSLNAENPFQLLVATRLSAQCTDARVNIVTPELFKRFPTPQKMAEADIEEVEDIIRSTGFFRMKARDLVIMSGQIVNDFGGEVPGTLEELTSLQGIGRKTANLICGDVFGMPGAVVADTHLIRITNRLGLVESKNPMIVERELRKILPPDESHDFCHRCVLHGRAVCTARTAKCDECCMNEFCKKKKYKK